MTAPKRGPMNLGVFFKNTGHHIAAWRHPGAQPDAGINIRHYADCARISERACFDFLFFADAAAVREKVPYDILARSSQFTAYFEPTTLLSALAMATERIGLVATATTSYNEPYHVARKFASIDHISGGRAGWNVVTSGNASEAQNFGRDAHYGHDARYQRAHEFVDVVKGLWDSWDDDAFLYDQKAGFFFDHRKLHVLDHAGEHFNVKGPLNIARPPQGHPVIFQAGTSDVGRDLAAATAEGVFTSELTLESSIAYYRDVKGRMAKYGRTPDQMRILPGCTVFCGRTEAEAKERYEYLQSLIDPIVGREYIGTLLGMDLSDCPLDGPLPDRPSPRSEMGTFKSIVALAKNEGLSIRQLYSRLAGSHGKLCLIGSVAQVADTMQQWFEEEACDGFILQPSTMPEDLVHLTETLIPELQARGLHRTAYRGDTLRDHLGLERPESRYE